ncbi:MAG: aquaporin [Planctomycetota bacterium]
MPETLEYETPAAALPEDPIPLRRRLAAEGVGTFLLVFFGCGSMAVDAAYGGAIGHVGIGIVWGVVVMALIYALGDVGGAHFNPAVSFAFWLSGRFPGKDALAYGGMQIVAATMAAVFLLVCFIGLQDLGQTVPRPPDTLRSSINFRDLTNSGRGFSYEVNVVLWEDIARAFSFEIVLTFALVFVILCVAVGSKERGLMAGTAIGGTVGICALAAGPVCRASMNPARSIGPAIAAVDFQHLWLYCVAPIIGAALAVLAWTYIYRHPKPGREVHEVTVPS